MEGVEQQIGCQHITELLQEKPVGIRVTPGGRYLVFTYQGRSARVSLDGWAVIHPIDPQTAFEILQMLDVTFYEGDIGDWAYGYGYDWPERGKDPATRSRTRAVWRYHRTVTKRMMLLFGDDFEVFMHADINDKEPMEEGDR
jgi:hypothetical protein